MAVSSAAGSAAAQPVSEENERVACLDAHEKSQVLRLEGKLLDARASMRVCSRDLCPAAIRSDCTDWLEQVQLQVPSVVFEARSKRGDETNVKVFADDRQITDKLDGEAIELDPGIYDFRFEHPVEKPVRTRVVVRAGEKNRVIAVEFKPPEEPKPADIGPGNVVPTPPVPEVEKYRPVTFPTYLFGGLALASAGAATYFGVTALGDYSKADDECAPGCSGDRTDPIKTKAILADAFIGGAVVFTGLATVFLLTRPTYERSPTDQPADTAPVLGFRAGRQGGLLELRGRF